MDGKKLEILMTAARMGSLSKAAQAAGYTQSGLTHMMDALEKEIGFPLLTRSHSGISLSPQGMELLPAIEAFLQAQENLQSRIQAVAQQKDNLIRIAAYSSIAMRWMPEILYRFKRLCPLINVDLRMVDHATEPFELLEKGETDVIFASRRDFPFCRWTPLYDEQMYAILPGDYPVEGRAAFPRQEFSGQEFLMPYGNFDADVLAILEPENIKLNATLSRVDDETVIRMVGRRLGISMMSELMIRGRTDDVICLPLDPPAVRQLGMGVHMRQEASPGIQALQQCVLKYISQLAQGPVPRI